MNCDLSTVARLSRAQGSCNVTGIHKKSTLRLCTLIGGIFTRTVSIRWFRFSICFILPGDTSLLDDSLRVRRSTQWADPPRPSITYICCRGIVIIFSYLRSPPLKDSGRTHQNIGDRTELPSTIPALSTSFMPRQGKLNGFPLNAVTTRLK